MKITTSYLKELIREAIKEGGGEYSPARAMRHASNPRIPVDSERTAYSSGQHDATSLEAMVADYELAVPVKKRSFRSFKQWLSRNIQTPAASHPGYGE